MNQKKQWSEGLIKLLFFSALIAVAGLAVFAALTFRLDNKAVVSQARPSFETDWYYLDGSGRKVEIRSFSKIEGNTEPSVIYNTLPEMDSDQVLCVDSHHQSLIVRVNDQVLFQQGINNQAAFGTYYGALWNVVTIPKEMSGQQISLEVGGPHAVSNSDHFSVLLGSGQDVLFYMGERYFGTFAFSFISFCIGIIILLIWLVSFLRNIEINRRSFFYLGLFSILASLWAFSDTRLAQLFTGNAAVPYLISFSSFMLMPIPFLLFLIDYYEEKQAKALRLIAIAFGILFFVNMGLYIFGAVELYQTIPLVHILLSGSLLLLLFFCFRERKFASGSKDIRDAFWGLVGLSAFSLFGIVRFYVWNHDDNSRYFRIGLLVFIVLLSISVCKKSIAVFKSKISAVAYKKLAYTDTMTGLRNRTAFDSDMDQMENNLGAFETIAILVFDLNNLKRTNDRHGHNAGDLLIRTSARCLESFFSYDGICYRIGGDEFVVILNNVDKFKIEEKLNQLNRVFDKENRRNSMKIDMAYGYDVKKAADIKKDGLYSLFNSADAFMYARKEKIKQMRGRENVTS